MNDEHLLADEEIEKAAALVRDHVRGFEGTWFAISDLRILLHAQHEKDMDICAEIRAKELDRYADMRNKEQALLIARHEEALKMLADAERMVRRIQGVV